MEEIKYYTIEEVSKKFDIHYNTVRNRILSGDIKALKIGNQWRIPANQWEESEDNKK